MTIFPIFIIIVNIIFWNFKKKGKAKNVLCILIIIDVIHPSIINSMIESLTCIEIDDSLYLRKDVYYSCYSSDHYLKVIFY